MIARLLGDLNRLGNQNSRRAVGPGPRDFAMAAYLPVLTVLAPAAPCSEAVGWTVALGALALAFLVSFRWGHVGRVLGHPEDEQLLLRILGTLIVAAIAEHAHASAAVGVPGGADAHR